MIAPPTNGYRILIYARYLALMETRRLLLASDEYRVNTVGDLKQFRYSVEQEQPPYELFILCHTVPEDERQAIRVIALRTGAGLYQLERMVQPIRFIYNVSEMLSANRKDA